jgi:DNA-directed RNA polymerase specialized sigma24 family protein
MDERNVRPGAGSAAPSGSDVSPGTSLSGTSVDDEAFSAFYRKFVPKLVAFLVWQGARLPDATKISQDTMVELYRSWSAIHHPETWARRVASQMLARHIISIKHDLVEAVHVETET